jgi:hypothetical protein
VSETRPYVDDAALEYEALRTYAWANNFFAQIHRNYTPFPGQDPRACWYLQRKRDKANPGVHVDSILKYSTAEEVRAYIDEHRKQAND